MDKDFQEQLEDLAFKRFLAQKGIPEKTDKIIKDLTPSSQGDLLLSQTSLEVNEKERDLTLKTSEFGHNLSENKNLPQANYYSISKWGKWRGIPKQYFYPITEKLRREPSNPHKHWFISLKKEITTYLGSES